jgi:hypothetical protein
LWNRRGDLRNASVDKRNASAFPSWPEFLARPKRRKTDAGDSESESDFERRRADGMEAICRVLITLVACCDWRSLEVRDPRGGYLSVARLAELAELPWRKEDREPGDRTERALRALRTAGIISFTKQWREKLDDGSHASTGPALRRISEGLFRKLGGMVWELFEGRRKNARKRDARAAAASETGVDLRIAAAMRAMNRKLSLPSIPPEDLDVIKRAHPDWTFGEVLAEARRRLDSS